MDRFRQRLRIRVLWTTCVFLIAALLYITLTASKNNLPKLPGFIRGYQTGIFFALELLLLGSLFKSLKAITSEAALKRRYIYENDERTILIAQKTGAAGMNICIAGLALSAVVTGFYNETAFFALFGAAAFAALVKGFFKLYFHFKI